MYPPGTYSVGLGHVTPLPCPPAPQVVEAVVRYLASTHVEPEAARALCAQVCAPGRRGAARLCSACL